MIFSVSTTAREVLAPDDDDRMITFSSGKFVSSATSIYIRKVNTLSPWIILSSTGKSQSSILIPHGTQLEAYTDAGTADLAVLKFCCSSSKPEQ